MIRIRKKSIIKLTIERNGEVCMSMSTIDRIQSLGFDMRDKYMDGYFQFGAKQKLYEILWEVQKQLKDSPTFVGEEEWIKNHCERS